MANYQKIGVIGAGAWGTALAATLARAGRDVTLWTRHAETAASINRERENKLYLPGIALDPAIKATYEVTALQNAEVVLFATPAQHLRDIAKLFCGMRADAPVLVTAKGIERGTCKWMSEIMAEEMPQHSIAILSGPSFAAEVAGAQPTALTLAVRDRALGEQLARALASPTFRPYLTDDVIGAQLGGAIKNVLAIACGIVTGKRLGDSARAALITRGLAEMMRLGAALGARPETLMGLSGLGDLVLTCSSPQSRNMSLGLELGAGGRLDHILAARHSVAEGVPTAAAALALAKKHKVDMPIVAAVASVLHGEADIDRAIANLLARPLKAEGV